MRIVIPLTTFKVHAVNIATIFWLFFDVLVCPMVLNIKRKFNAIDSEVALS